MMSYEETKEFVDTVRRFTKMYKAKLTEFGAAMAQHEGTMSAHDYLKVMTEMSDDMFAGVMLALAFDDTCDGMKAIEDVVDGRVSLDSYLEEFYITE